MTDKRLLIRRRQHTFGRSMWAETGSRDTNFVRQTQPGTRNCYKLGPPPPLFLSEYIDLQIQSFTVLLCFNDVRAEPSGWNSPTAEWPTQDFACHRQTPIRRVPIRCCFIQFPPSADQSYKGGGFLSRATSGEVVSYLM